MKNALLLVAPLVLAACATTDAPPAAPSAGSGDFASTWSHAPDRVWVGPEFWANRLQDWSVRDGGLRCDSNLAWRTLHLLTRRVGSEEGTIEMSVRLRFTPGEGGALPDEAVVGFLLGAGGGDLDHRSACLVQSAPGPHGGLLAGIDGRGQLHLDRFDAPLEYASLAEQDLPHLDPALLADVTLVLTVSPKGINLEARDPMTGSVHAQLLGGGVDSEGNFGLGRHLIPSRDLAGNVALVAHPGPPKQAAHFRFADWHVAGSRVETHPDRALGPILSAQHTLSRGVMNMTAQMMPIGEDDPRDVTLQIRESRKWKDVATAPIVVPGYTATFHIEDWRWRKDTKYRLVYAMPDGAGGVREHEWTGTVRRDPVNKDEIVLAAFTGNHNVRHGFGGKDYPWGAETLWFPHADLVRHVEHHAPDLLFFSGDQIYEGASPTRAERRDQPELDYLYKWYLWCWAYRELTRDIPCITVPDDHDVYQGNLWGQGGRPAKVDNQGGYVMPAEWVKMVERTQTSNLPAPFHDEPIEQGIGRYYTSLRVGGIDFAILEDRKFKSGCAGLVKHDGPRPDHINDPNFNMARADVPGAKLLGDDQLAFLDAWGRDWNGVTMKSALSQTVFANVATLHGGNLDRLRADLDANGWPQAGRNRALAALRIPSAFMVGGDQHLATIVHHGIDTWDDAGWSFCVPSIANFYPRAWVPLTPGEDREPGAPEFTGRHLDGFGNHVTVYAATNPGEPQGREPAALHDKMPGYGIVRYDKQARTITMECWPRGADPKRDAQYPGWPRTVQQYDNDGRVAVAELPPLRIHGIEAPVVQVLDAGTGELVYARRYAETELHLGVFHPGSYDVLVGEPETDRWKLLSDLPTSGEDVIDIRL